MLHDVVDGAADAVGEGDLGVEARNQGFKFRVVEDDADGFVAEEFAFHVVGLGGDGGQEVGGCVAGFRGDAEGGGDGFVDLVPGEGFVGGDIDILVREVPEQAEIAFDLEGEEADEFAYRVENLVTQAFFHESLVVDVSDNVPDAGGHLSRAVPQVQQPQFIAAFGQ